VEMPASSYCDTALVGMGLQPAHGHWSNQRCAAQMSHTLQGGFKTIQYRLPYIFQREFSRWKPVVATVSSAHSSRSTVCAQSDLRLASYETEAALAPVGSQPRSNTPRQSQCGSRHVARKLRGSSRAQRGKLASTALTLHHQTRPERHAQMSPPVRAAPRTKREIRVCMLKDAKRGPKARRRARFGKVTTDVASSAFEAQPRRILAGQRGTCVCCTPLL